jgi:hypothetical protein
MSPPFSQASRAAMGALILLLPALLMFGGCSQTSVPVDVPDDSGPGVNWLEDVTAASGLDFHHDADVRQTYFMPKIMGSGGAFIHDGDGSLYVYLLHLGGPQGKKNQLFKRQADGTFKDVSQGSGLDIAGYCTGVAVGDVDNDGLPDVIVTQYGGIKLFLNRGGGHFEDATDEAGLTNPLWGMSAALFDYDRDGWLDLVVVNYLDYDPKFDCLSAAAIKDFCVPQVFPGRSAKLLHNRGPRAAASGTKAARVWFEDVSFASGVGRVPGPGLGVCCADFDGDGWPDIFVANDGQPNRLWINQKDGTFKEEATSRGVAVNAMANAFAGMGVAIGDLAGSGLFDLFVTHLGSETNTLWQQGPRGQFKDRTIESKLTARRWRGTGFGTVMADFDLDGALDIAVVNGRIHSGGEATGSNLGFWETYAERNQLFANDGTGKFHDVSPANNPFCGAWNVGRGLACADFNNDGAPGLLVTASGGRARLFKNVAPNRGHWLKVRALDPKRKRDAYGAEVRVRAGQRTWLRFINPAEGYLCSGSPWALFGLGKVQRIESIEVTWPDSTGPQVEVFEGGLVDRQLQLHRGEGRQP